MSPIIASILVGVASRDGAAASFARRGVNLFGGRFLRAAASVYGIPQALANRKGGAIFQRPAGRRRAEDPGS